MKKLIACPIAWMLYKLGDWVNRPTYWGSPDGFWQTTYAHRSYWLYNGLMQRSIAVQDWAVPHIDGTIWWRWWPWSKHYSREEKP